MTVTWFAGDKHPALRRVSIVYLNRLQKRGNNSLISPLPLVTAILFSGKLSIPKPPPINASRKSMHRKGGETTYPLEKTVKQRATTQGVSYLTCPTTWKRYEIVRLTRN